MKYIQLFFMLIIFLSSCTYEEKTIFDLSPAERLNDAMLSHKNTFLSAPNGWEMQYFANPESAGYTLLVKFETSGKAIFAAQNEYTQNNAFEKDSSLFEIIGDNGPVLTFNTYNKILHRYSNPENPDGYGLQGDYEFIIISSTADKVILKGKKYKSEIILTKISDNTNWQQLLQAINHTDSLIFSASSPKLTLNTNNANYSFADGYTHIFNFKKVGSATTQSIPFIVTKNGIRLYKELEIESKKYQNFELSTDGSALISSEYPSDRLIGTDDLASYFVTNAKVWKLNSEKMSTDFKNSYTKISTDFATVYGAESIDMSVLYALNRVSFVLKISYTKDNTQVDGLIDIGLNTVSKDGLAIVRKNSADTNGQKFTNEVASLNDFLTQIASEYTLKTATKLNPIRIDFIKKTNANAWFTLSDK